VGGSIRPASHGTISYMSYKTLDLRAQVTALAGGTAFLALFSTPEAEDLYQGTGFAPRPPLTGMWQVLTDEARQGAPTESA
jgi:hypothetical protein